MTDTTKSEPPKKRNVRQIILVAILFVVAIAYAVDHYVLIPSATKKINEITVEVSKKLTDKNREQVHEIVGMNQPQLLRTKV